MAIKAQKNPPGKLALPPDLLAAWLRAAAEVAAARLQGGALPRARRRECRDLLLQAYRALDEQAVPIEVLRRLDALGPPGPPIPRPVQIGWQRRLAVLDRALLDRVFAYEAPHDTIVGRAERFLAATGRGTLTLVVKPLATGDGVELDMALTEG